MYSFWQRVGSVFSFFTSCLFIALPLIAALNYFIKQADPQVSISLDKVSNRLGVEDYFMNKKVMLTDIVLNFDAGTFLLLNFCLSNWLIFTCLYRLYALVSLEHQAALFVYCARV